MATWHTVKNPPEKSGMYLTYAPEAKQQFRVMPYSTMHKKFGCTDFLSGCLAADVETGVTHWAWLVAPGKILKDIM